MSKLDNLVYEEKEDGGYVELVPQAARLKVNDQTFYMSCSPVRTSESEGLVWEYSLFSQTERGAWVCPENSRGASSILPLEDDIKAIMQRHFDEPITSFKASVIEYDVFKDISEDSGVPEVERHVPKTSAELLRNRFEVTAPEGMEQAEIDAYIQVAFEKWPFANKLDIKLEEGGEDVSLHPGVNLGFERIRRITGYLVGDMSRWNDAKSAEQADRVKHSVGLGGMMDCAQAGLAAADGSAVCDKAELDAPGDR